ncbi:tyrosine-type recombinase/integrase [Pseudodesulfovibrio sp. JC047]|uniref:tyrosine-type recombinase/integrase n=1 Tax=Pseudodesulfovibrio sp. JC047 TaxID=2683199 RepID=UPI0013D240FC|nr:tyrosine-type recombinase/integrase [Pseudodesulfovibrio sp. JC047]NDV19082.1 tyrosine-type recombinase/integrase [Pseudodesulfovibrio sp. JC047]
MKGNIYTSERCPVCHAIFKHDQNRNGMFCQEHPEIRASERQLVVRFGKEVTKRFKNYDLARQFLNGLRYETAEGSFDPRKYAKARPLSFSNQSAKWLAVKKQSGVSRSYMRSLENYIGKAERAWLDKDVNMISYGDIEDFALSLDCGDKTKANTLAALNQFFKWVEKREGFPAPQMPEIKYTLGWREIIDTNTQSAIIDEIERIAPRRVWIGIKWLATYVAIRPNEIRELREADINVNGFIICRPDTTKEKKPKIVPMLEEDIELYNSFPQGLPHLHFFRNESGRGVPARCRGKQVSKNIFYDWWKRACKNLGIVGVDLYGGTRHSTTTALSEHFSRDELRESGTMHGTNKAFERYMQKEATPSRNIYAKARQLSEKKKGKIIVLNQGDKTH